MAGAHRATCTECGVPLSADDPPEPCWRCLFRANLVSHYLIPSFRAVDRLGP